MRRGAERHRSLATEARDRGWKGAWHLHEQLGTFFDWGEGRPSQALETLHKELAPRWEIAEVAPACQFLTAGLPKGDELGALTPVRIKATCEFGGSHERKLESYTYQEAGPDRTSRHCEDRISYSYRDGPNKSVIETTRVTPVCENVRVAGPPVTKTGTRWADSYKSKLTIRGALRIGDGEGAKVVPFDVAFDSYESGKTDLSPWAQSQLESPARKALADRLAEHERAGRSDRGGAQLERAKRTLDAGGLLESEDALVLAAADGVKIPEDLTRRVAEARSLPTDAVGRLLEGSTLASAVAEAPPSHLPVPEYPVRSASRGVSHRPTPQLDHMAWVYAAGGYALPTRALEPSAASLAIGLQALRTKRDSAFGLAWSWGFEGGFDHHLSFLFDAHGGLGAALTLWRLTLAPMGMLAVDRMVINDSDQSLVPLAFDYGGGGHLYLELSEKVALDGHGAYLWRTGDNPGELRTGLRLAIRIGKRALFLGARYHDYGRATAWTGFVGYGGD